MTKEPVQKALSFRPQALHSTDMTSPPPRVLIIGGNSSIARHLLMLLPDARAVARTSTRPRVTAIDDYHRLHPRHFAGIGTVINCAGIVNGPEAALRAVNVDLQVSLAAAAREAGVARYVAIGSFSIFGACERIDPNTPTAPDDAYGHSKLDGDHALQQLQTEQFATVSVAFPTIIGTTRVGKVERMLRLWQRMGIWPVPSGDIARSMIGAEGAAKVLACAAADDVTGRVLAADTVAFSYRDAAKWLREDAGGAFAHLRIPRVGVALFRRTMPSLYRSTMSDSLLDPACNYAVGCAVESSLRRELANALLRGKN